MPVANSRERSSSCRQKRGLDEVIVRRYVVDTLEYAVVYSTVES
jgi:hypothetical protein